MRRVELLANLAVAVVMYGWLVIIIGAGVFW